MCNLKESFSHLLLAITIYVQYFKKDYKQFLIPLTTPDGMVGNLKDSHFALATAPGQISCSRVLKKLETKAMV